MAKSVTVQVPEGYTTHKGVETTIVIREPNYDDYCDLGEVFDPVPTGDGRAYFVENKATVRAYMERLITHPADKLILGNLPIKYAREVREAVIGFFRVSPKEGTSTTSGENSSGEQEDGSQQNT